jgi:hypothetical protein
MTGDPFGDGALFETLSGFAGTFYLGIIRVTANQAIASHTWWLRRTDGISGVDDAGCRSLAHPGTWVAKPEFSISVNSVQPCDTCAPLVQPYCAQAVDPTTWSATKQLFR